MSKQGYIPKNLHFNSEGREKLMSGILVTFQYFFNVRDKSRLGFGKLEALVEANGSFDEDK